MANGVSSPNVLVFYYTNGNKRDAAAKSLHHVLGVYMKWQINANPKKFVHVLLNY